MTKEKSLEEQNFKYLEARIVAVLERLIKLENAVADINKTQIELVRIHTLKRTSSYLGHPTNEELFP